MAKPKKYYAGGGGGGRIDPKGREHNTRMDGCGEQWHMGGWVTDRPQAATLSIHTHIISVGNQRLQQCWCSWQPDASCRGTVSWRPRSDCGRNLLYNGTVTRGGAWCPKAPKCDSWESRSLLVPPKRGSQLE